MSLPLFLTFFFFLSVNRSKCVGASGDLNRNGIRNLIYLNVLNEWSLGSDAT